MTNEIHYSHTYNQFEKLNKINFLFQIVIGIIASGGEFGQPPVRLGGGVSMLPPEDDERAPQQRRQQLEQHPQPAGQFPPRPKQGGPRRSARVATPESGGGGGGGHLRGGHRQLAETDAAQGDLQRFQVGIFYTD